MGNSNCEMTETQIFVDYEKTNDSPHLFKREKTIYAYAEDQITF